MSSKTVVDCIYCGATVDLTKGVGDHIIPAALGEFAEADSFRRICRSCNSLIGSAEEQLLRCGPESYIRRLVNAKSKRTQKRKSGVSTGALGMKPPSYRVELGDHWEMVRPSKEDIRDGLALDQVVVSDADGQEATIQLFPGMSSIQLKERVSKSGLAEVKQIRLYCDEQHTEEFVAPEYVPNTYCITLGKLDAVIALPKPAWAHLYTYENREDRFAGTARKIPIVRMR